ncbi:DUF47 family protein [Agromyces sp. G08B096]|uniref:DUF47 family protein n=1 Tax=Agromyces sp. G08B096 TaxID=3156399 RepID=A0AAU7W6P3_9MICO
MGERRQTRQRLGGDGAGDAAGRVRGRADRGRRRGLRLLPSALGSRTDRELVRRLSEQVAALDRGVEVTARMLRGELEPEAARRRLRRIEHDGDDARGAVVEAISRAFITPIDREDLFRLSRSIDDVLDTVRDLVREYDLYRMPPDPVLATVFAGVAAAVPRLGEAVGELGADTTRLREAALQAKKNDVRRRFQRAMAELLEGAGSDARALERRELLRRVDGIGLRLGEAADAIADGAVKRGA